MQVFNKISEYQDFYRNELKDLSLGLVPTMGNLHFGHLGLVKKALEANQKVVVTIFVNPTQFGPGEDFDKYPRTLEQDLFKLKELEGAENIIVIAPQSPSEIYPKDFSTEIKVNAFKNIMCDKFRPGHFHGVTTVVYRLFQMAKAQNAYFGQKDFQQFKVIEKMTQDLELPVKCHCLPIARESDGLALSSRNQYLSNEQREKAPLIHETLKELGEVFCKNPNEAIKRQTEILKQDPSWQYLDLRDAYDLSEANSNTTHLVVAGAYFMGDTRLIDNIVFNMRK